MNMHDDNDELPDVRDGLKRKERIILHCLHEAQKELGDRNVPTIMLYGRVVEQIDISKDGFQALLTGLMSRSEGDPPKR